MFEISSDQKGRGNITLWVQFCRNERMTHMSQFSWGRVYSTKRRIIHSIIMIENEGKICWYRFRRNVKLMTTATSNLGTGLGYPTLFQAILRYSSLISPNPESATYFYLGQNLEYCDNRKKPNQIQQTQPLSFNCWNRFSLNDIEVTIWMHGPKKNRQKIPA